MYNYIVLIWDRHDTYNRHWVRCETLERAQQISKNYEAGNKWVAEIFELGKAL